MGINMPIRKRDAKDTKTVCGLVGEGVLVEEDIREGVVDKQEVILEAV
jgi:hypothetical protein